MSVPITKKTYRLNTGAEIPAIGLGTWQSAPEEVRVAVKAALEAGYRHIDTAEDYENEREVGKAIRESGIPREEIWVTTKLNNPWHKRVSEGLQKSLNDLGLDYVDLYLIHWPSSWDPNHPGQVYSDWDYVDTWREMQKLLDTGKVKNIGVSNFGIRHLEKLLNDPSCRVVPSVNQIELHPGNPSPKLVAYNEAKGIHLTAYSCLGSTSSPLLKEPALLEIAARVNKSPQQVLLAWNVQKGRSVIPKSVTPQRIQANFDLDGWQVTDDEIKSIDQIKLRFKVCDDDWLPQKVFFGDDE